MKTPEWFKNRAKNSTVIWRKQETWTDNEKRKLVIPEGKTAEIYAAELYAVGFSHPQSSIHWKVENGQLFEYSMCSIGD